MKYLFLTLVFCFIQLATFSQSVQGIVMDKNDNSPLIGVNVITNSSGTITDFDGKFELKLLEGENILIFSYLGYKELKKTVKVAKSQKITIEIKLEESITKLNTVVVSAGKFEQKIEETTVSIEVLKASLIESKNTTNIQNAIDQIPGVNITDGQANIRGGSGWSYGAGTRVQVLVDDLPLISGDAGQAQWSLIATENINQVEVIKGASSSLYGSSALNGVINIRTAYPGNTPETKINLHHGYYDDAKRESLNWWGGRNQKVSGFDFLHKRKIGNLDLVAGGFYLRDEGYRYLEDTQRYRLNFNTRYKDQKIEGLTYGLNANFLKNETASALIWQDYETAYIPLDSSVTKTSGDVYNIDPFITYINPKNQDSHQLKGRFMHVINDNSTKNNKDGQDNKSDTYYLEYQYQKKIDWLKLNWTSGSVYEYVNAKSKLFQGNNFRENIALFTQVDKKIGNRINLSLGARYERFSLKTGQFYVLEDGDSTDNIFDSKPVFRSGINYKLSESTFLRSSYGQGYRFPSIAELFIETEVASGIWVYDNPSLTPEQGWSSEIAVKQLYKLGNLVGYIDLALFTMEYKDMMEFSFGQWRPFALDNLGIGFKSINIGDTKISGLELSMAGSITFDEFKLNFLGGYTYIDPKPKDPNKIYDEDINGQGLNFYNTSSIDSSDLFLKYRYEHLAKLDVELVHGKKSFGISARYNSFMKNIDAIFVSPGFSGIIPGISESREKLNTGDLIIDLRLVYQINKNNSASLIINNALNREYQTRPANLMPPRMVSLKWGIKL
jgi:iron complex outermembrane receptor protein